MSALIYSHLTYDSVEMLFPQFYLVSLADVATFTFISLEILNSSQIINALITAVALSLPEAYLVSLVIQF